MTTHKTASYTRLLTWATFLVLMSYVLLRAAFVSPLHDEVATYFHFIESGYIWGDGAILDANNHLLNSLCGWISYKLFGESFFFFRLPNVLSFVLYFWGIRQLTKQLEPVTGYLALLGITSIPYVLEYFAYTRGYGISIACFVWVLVFAQRTIKNYKLLNVAGLFLFAFLALAANLSFLTTGCLALLIAGIYFLKNFRKIGRWQLIGIPVITIGFLLACWPLVSLSMKMKEAGTLYYGSLDGLWDVTGKTLSRYVLFTDNDALCWAFAGLIALLLVVQLIRLIRKGLWSYLATTGGLLTFFFTGLLVMIIVMAELLQINYPEDRVGMYFIPLFLLLFVYTVAEHQLARKTAFLLAVFPVTLLLHLSLSTSIFTPDERMTDTFYASVKKHLEPGSTLLGYPTMELTWALHERKAEFKNFMHLDRSFQPDADLVLVKTALLDPKTSLKGYELVAEDTEAGYRAYKRFKAPQRKPLAMISLDNNASQGEYIDIARFETQDNWQGKPLHIAVKGTLKREGNTPVETIVISSAKTDGSGFRYEAFDLRWYNGIQKAEIPFEMHYELPALDTNEAGFTVYAWNKFLYPMAVEQCTVTVYSLIKD